jgi:hypothetical protein
MDETSRIAGAGRKAKRRDDALSIPESISVALQKAVFLAKEQQIKNCLWV